MTATLIKFPEPPASNEGNRVLEAVRDYLDRIHPARILGRAVATPEDLPDHMPYGDHLLLWLWNEGFKVVPIEDDDLGD